MSWETQLVNAAQRTEVHLRELRTDVERLSESLPSRRERIATAALQAMLTRGSDEPMWRYENWREEFAREAVRFADDLIAALDKPKEGNER